jgi:hypothetical protein
MNLRRSIISKMPGGAKNAKAAFDAAQSPQFYKNWPVCNCGALMANGTL